MSLNGLGERPFMAAMYSMALDASQRPKLFRVLRGVACAIGDTEEWPERMPAIKGQPHHYGDELVGLVLDEDWLKPLFQAAPALYWIYVDVPEDVWRGKLFRYYLSVRARYDRWLDIARGHVNRRIAEEFYRVEGIDTVRKAG